MAHDVAAIDINTNTPSLADLVEEVERTRQPRDQTGGCGCRDHYPGACSPRQSGGERTLLPNY